MKFKNNKYTCWYWNIIKKAKQQKRDKKVSYFENHHITPKSMGGDNTKQNLVLLTAREHYIVHMLLVRMVPSNCVYKMVAAVVRFSIKSRTSQQFETLRKTAARFSRGKLNCSYQKKWCHHTETKHILYVKKANIPEGYVIGLPFQRGGRNRNVLYMWINDGYNETMVPKDNNIVLPWTLGRFHQHPQKHMVKMSAMRHTKKQDDKHAELLRGRITIKHRTTGNIKRISPTKLSTYENYLPYGDCTVNNTYYLSVRYASKSLRINPDTIKARCLSKNGKWKDWNFINYDHN